MTAKEKLLELAPRWSEEQAQRALGLVEKEPEDDVGAPEMASAPESWGWDKTAWGAPMPNVVAWIDESRQGR